MEGSLELAYLLASLGSTKLFWLYYIQHFLTKTGKETRFDIHLPDFINTANANMNPTDFKHRYEWENLIVVNSLNLSENILMTSRAFLMVTLTIIIRLPFKIHLHPTALRPSSSSSKVYTLFSYMDPLSNFMASSHSFESGPSITSP